MKSLTEQINEGLALTITYAICIGLFAMSCEIMGGAGSHGVNKNGLLANIKENGFMTGLALYVLGKCKNLMKFYEEYDLMDDIERLQQDKKFQDFMKKPKDDKSLDELEQIANDCLGADIDKAGINKVWKAIQQDNPQAKQITIK